MNEFIALDDGAREALILIAALFIAHPHTFAQNPVAPETLSADITDLLVGVETMNETVLQAEIARYFDAYGAAHFFTQLRPLVAEIKSDVFDYSVEEAQTLRAELHGRGLTSAYFATLHDELARGDDPNETDAQALAVSADMEYIVTAIEVIAENDGRDVEKEPEYAAFWAAAFTRGFA